MDTDCELSRRSARLRGEAGVGRNRNGTGRCHITGGYQRSERRIALLGSVDQAVESGTVATRWSVRPECLDRIVVRVHDVGDRIHREGEQQADEHGSQPGGRPAERTARQLQDGHIAEYQVMEPRALALLGSPEGLAGNQCRQASPSQATGWPGQNHRAGSHPGSWPGKLAEAPPLCKARKSHAQSREGTGPRTPGTAQASHWGRTGYGIGRPLALAERLGP
jgi:hypothetical protein